MSTSMYSRSRSALLAEEIVQNGELAYSPELSAQDRASAEIKFTSLLSQAKTMALMPVLTSLIQPGRVQPWLRPHLVQALAVLPLRPQGVRHTIEFVLSVHPSTAQRVDSGQSSTAASQGPAVSLEGLSTASRLIATPPSSLSPDAWFSGIANQLLSLLDGEGGLEMVKAASFIIGYGILGSRALGAPGAPGWKWLAVPILARIDPSQSDKWPPDGDPVSKDSTIPLVMPQNVIVTAPQISDALRRLVSLLTSHPNPGLSKRLLGRLLLPLWSLSSFQGNDDGEFEESYRNPARFLLQVLLQLSSTADHIVTMTQNLLYKGNRDNKQLCWTYVPALSGGVQIERRSELEEGSFALDNHAVAAIEQKLDAFVELVRPSKDNDQVPSLFLYLCKRCLLNANETGDTEVYLIDNDRILDDNTESKIVDAKLMQKLITSLPERLISDSQQVVELAHKVLHNALANVADLDSDDTVAIALSLLNLVFTTMSFSKTAQNQALQESVKELLQSIAGKPNSEASVTAQNLLLLLEFQAEERSHPESTPAPLDKDVEDRRTYSLALSYLRSTDSPPPVRAQGLDLLSGLLAANSRIPDIPATIVLLSSILQDEEEYIYLRAVKAFMLLSIKHPKTVMLSILERYVDQNEEATLESRLRLGEALLQVIEKAGETFTGDFARRVAEGLLSVAGRRGYKPKRQAEHRKKAAATKDKNVDAEKAWGGPVPQLEEAPDVSREEDILAQIVEGWDSKSGEEDVRVRSSALSVLGSAIETNIAGLGSSMISTAVDLSIHILTLEPEPEKAILRRAATLLIMSLIRALDHAQDKGTSLGFGFAGQSLDDVLKILRYVSETDNDGLVRQHSKDVIEGLSTWQVKGLMAAGQDSRTQLEGLAGLSIDSRTSSNRTQPPRIEEVE